MSAPADVIVVVSTDNYVAPVIKVDQKVFRTEVK